MTQEAKVARFVLKLNAPMDTRLQSLRLSTFAEVLDARRPVEQEVSKPVAKDLKFQPTKDIQPRKREGDLPTQRQAESKQRLAPHLFDKAIRDCLCLRCMDPTHQVRNCPLTDSSTFPRPRSLPWNGTNTQRNFNNGYNGRAYNNNNANPNFIPVANNQNFNQNQVNRANLPNANRQIPNQLPQAQGNQRPIANVNPRTQPFESSSEPNASST